MLEYLLVFVQVALMFLIACLALLQKYLGSLWPFELPPLLRCLSLLGIVWSSVLIFGGGLKLGKYARVMPKPAKKAPLRTTGVYSFCRHPMYSGFLMAAFFWSTYQQSKFGYFLTFLLSLVLIYKITIEEKYLLSLYGSEYESYQSKVGMLFPRVFKKDYWK